MHISGPTLSTVSIVGGLDKTSLQETENVIVENRTAVVWRNFSLES